MQLNHRLARATFEVLSRTWSVEHQVHQRILERTGVHYRDAEVRSQLRQLQKAGFIESRLVFEGGRGRVRFRRKNSVRELDSSLVAPVLLVVFTSPTRVKRSPLTFVRTLLASVKRD